MDRRRPQRYDPYAQPIEPPGQPSPSRGDSPTNRERRAELHRLLEELLAASLQRSWYGRISLEILIEDGIIQQKLIQRTERTQRL